MEFSLDNLDDDMETTGGDSSTNSAVDSEEGSVEVIHDKMRFVFI